MNTGNRRSPVEPVDHKKCLRLLLAREADSFRFFHLRNTALVNMDDDLSEGHRVHVFFDEVAPFRWNGWIVGMIRAF